ncbi:MAG: hypothetical protein F6K54_29855 [Okeania sp. SIO3B5]|uniref:hypothetical protein n=1 Tax=Okeania sp. SIO3B5 TaxID=2607811 RepID=UPI0013FFD64C|nr:hypothetical protein [Okeania sp. SIO3B5]NEO56909.1 hypothetical protein [Okeania sp. SIO3B5]
MDIIKTIKTLDWHNQVSIESKFYGKIPPSYLENINNPEWMKNQFKVVVEKAVFTQVAEIQLRGKVFGDAICAARLLGPLEEGKLDFVAIFAPTISLDVAESFRRLHKISYRTLVDHIFEKAKRLTSKNYRSVSEEISSLKQGLLNDLSDQAKYTLHQMWSLKTKEESLYRKELVDEFNRNN